MRDATDETFLRRFLEAAPALPVDVASWATGRLLASLTAPRRRAERDRLLREAAALLPDAPPWSKACELHAMAGEVRRAVPTHPDTRTARGCIASALLLDGRALSERQIYRRIVRV